MKARIHITGTDITGSHITGIDRSGGDLIVDLSRPIDLAITQDFSNVQPRHFGAPAADTHPFCVPGFSGSVAQGASCNCNVITLIPHCNGTHTECVGHLTTERLDAYRQVPAGLLPALLVSIEPVDTHQPASSPAAAPHSAAAAPRSAAAAPHSADTRLGDATRPPNTRPAATPFPESTDPAPHPGDRLITRHALEHNWPQTPAIQPRALVIRTLPNDTAKTHRDYSNSTPPYLTRDAAQFLVARGIEHLVVDLPSIDRSHDEGCLTAHRIFFGLPPRSTALNAAERPNNTVTELAFIPDEAADGLYLLQIQVPAIGGDAVPSRPLLYTFERA